MDKNYSLSILGNDNISDFMLTSALTNVSDVFFVCISGMINFIKFKISPTFVVCSGGIGGFDCGEL